MSGPKVTAANETHEEFLGVLRQNARSMIDIAEARQPGGPAIQVAALQAVAVLRVAEAIGRLAMVLEPAVKAISSAKGGAGVPTCFGQGRSPLHDAEADCHTCPFDAECAKTSKQRADFTLG